MMKEEKHPGGRLAKAVRVETGWAGEGEWGRGRRRQEEMKRKGTQVPQYRDFILVCFFFAAFYRRAESGAVATHPLLRCEPLSGRHSDRMVAIEPHCGWKVKVLPPRPKPSEQGTQTYFLTSF